MRKKLLLFKTWDVVVLIALVTLIIINNVSAKAKSSCGPYGFRCIDSHSYELCNSENDEKQKDCGKATECPQNSICDESSPQHCKPSNENDQKKPARENNCETDNLSNSTTSEKHQNKFSCSCAGNFIDKSNCNKYWYCDVDKKGELIPVHKECPENHHFDETYKECILNMRESRAAAAEDAKCPKLTTKMFIVVVSEDTEKPQNEKTEKPQNEKTEKPENEKTEKPENEKETTHTTITTLSMLSSVSTLSTVSSTISSVIETTTDSCDTIAAVTTENSTFSTLLQQNITTLTSLSTNATTTDSAICEQTNFRCPGTGMYPDPNDCSVFYICVKKREINDKELTVIKMFCPKGTAFDRLTRTCTKQEKEHSMYKHKVDDNETNFYNAQLVGNLYAFGDGNNKTLDAKFSDNENKSNGVRNEMFVGQLKSSNHVKSRSNGLYFMNPDLSDMQSRTKMKRKRKTELYGGMNEIGNGYQKRNVRHKKRQRSKRKENKTHRSKRSESDEFNCEKYGRFPDIRDRKKYFICIRNLNDRGYSIMSMTCPRSLLFDTATMSCRRSDSMKDFGDVKNQIQPFVADWKRRYYNLPLYYT